MNDRTQRYGAQAEEEPMRLEELLEPFDGQPNPPLSEDRDDFANDDDYRQEEPSPYDPLSSYDDEYSDYHEQLDHEGRMRTAMGAVNVISSLAGVVVVFVLVAMLLGLVTWLKNDILHSLSLLQGGIG